MGVLSSNKLPLQQLAVKKGLGVFSRVGVFSRDYGTLVIYYFHPPSKYESSQSHNSVPTVYSCSGFFLFLFQCVPTVTSDLPVELLHQRDA